MKNKFYLNNIVLLLEVFLLCGAVILIRTFLPGVSMPRLDLPMLTVLSVIPMILCGLVQAERKGNRIFSLLLAGVSFALLPFAAGWSVDLPLWKIFMAGTVVFGITDVIYTSMLDRISSGNHAPFSLITNGILLWLASQCFQAMI